MSFTRRSLLATLGLTLPVAAAEAATKRGKKPGTGHVAHAKAPAHTASHGTAHASRSARLRRAAPRAQG